MLMEVCFFNEIEPGRIGLQITDAHIYMNHNVGLYEYINRPILKSPLFVWSTDYKMPKLEGYEHGDHIKFKLNV